jgi:hypothetical protein
VGKRTTHAHKRRVAHLRGLITLGLARVLHVDEPPDTVIPAHGNDHAKQLGSEVEATAQLAVGVVWQRLHLQLATLANCRVLDGGGGALPVGGRRACEIVACEGWEDFKANKTCFFLFCDAAAFV